MIRASTTHERLGGSSSRGSRLFGIQVEHVHGVAVLAATAPT